MQLSYQLLSSLAKDGDVDAINTQDVWDRLEGGKLSGKVEAHYNLAQGYHLLDKRAGAPKRTRTMLGMKVITPMGGFLPQRPILVGMPAVTLTDIDQPFGDK